MGAGYLVPVENNRPATITAMDLGQQGTDLLRTSLLQDLGSPLSSFMAGFIDNQDLCFAAVEQGSMLEQTLEFKTSMNTPTVAVRTWLANYISHHWSADCQLVFEDSWMLKRDIENHPPNCPYFFVNGTPCYVPTGNTLSALTLGNKKVISHHYAAFVVSPPVALPAIGLDMTPQQKQAMAENTRAILLSAYDGEGFVVWQKQKSSTPPAT